MALGLPYSTARMHAVGGQLDPVGDVASGVVAARDTAGVVIGITMTFDDTPLSLVDEAGTIAFLGS